MEEGEHGNTRRNSFLEEIIKKKKYMAETQLQALACNILSRTDLRKHDEL